MNNRCNERTQKYCHKTVVCKHSQKLAHTASCTFLHAVCHGIHAIQEQSQPSDESKQTRYVIDAVITKNVDKAKDVYKTEKTINNMEKMLTEYLVKINNLSLTEEQKIIINNLFYSINDIERVGDHAENLAEQAEYMAEHEVAFSETGISDLKIICQAAYQSFSHSIDARRRGDMDEVRKVIQYEDEVDALEEELREKHIERLSTGECSTAAGVVFLDLISNLERISDHAYNLAGYVKNEM